MVRVPCCERMGLKKGPWTAEEDQILISYIQRYGHENWRALPRQAGLLRCGKSCRLRWTNYLRPDIKRGNFTKEEQETIIKLHQMLGNRWSAIATKLPGRTDNEIKNYWHTHLKKRVEGNPAAAASGRLMRFSSSILGTNDGRLIPAESWNSSLNNDDHPAAAGNNYFQKNGYYIHNNNLHYGQQNHHGICSSSVEDSSSAAAPMQSKRDQISKKNSSSGAGSGSGAEETSYGKISAVVQGLFPFTNKYYNYSMAALDSRAQILSTTGEYSEVLQQPWATGNEYCNNSDMDFWYNLFVKSQENQEKVA